MKRLSLLASLALVGSVLVAVPTLQAMASPPAAPSPSLVQQMKNTASGTATVHAEKATGKVGFVRAGSGKDLLPGVAGGSKSEAVAKSDAYLAKFGAAFGAAKGQLVRDSVVDNGYGWTVSYHQEYRGVPVFAGLVKSSIDADGHLVAVNGFAIPDLDLSVTPSKSAATAAAAAVQMVRNDPPGVEKGAKVDTRGLKAVSNQLRIYLTGALRGEPGQAILVRQIEVTNKKNIRDMVFIDANTGKPVNRYSIIGNALDRELREASGPPANPVFTTVWEEGDAFPGSLNIDQQNLVNSAGEAYWFYRNAFGRDSYDGNGAKMITVNNDPRIACPNANWNGVTTNYCNGVTSDDVVSHEWGHAYTEYTDGLIYQWQPGALNESYSDIWGETLDLINGREDEGEGDINIKREVGSCDPTAPPRLIMTITAPASAAGPCTAVPAAFGPDFTTDELTAEIVVATDEANATGPSTTDGCTAFTNAAAVAGKWAFVDRGTCPFVAKQDNAVAAGAIGLVVGNNQPGLPLSMAGTVDIYGVMVSQADGTRIKAAGGPVTATLSAEDTSTRKATTRWLIGEKSTAFGGAIRDMWNPTCYQDPGKVTDAEYNCDFAMTDNGGVHGNSGVPNHGYALLVDGGTYNGQTVRGIGLTKAAAIYWRAESVYQGPASDFADHADALARSCQDLIGKKINELSTQPNDARASQKVITADDCAQVPKMAAAVELYEALPEQCNFQPVLDPNSPSLCGDGFDSVPFFEDDFEEGVGANGWTQDSETLIPGGVTRDWVTNNEAPGDNATTVAYGPAPAIGACEATPASFESVNYLISPEIEVPDGASPRMSFRHYVATEAGWDGGNVQLSINGGDYESLEGDVYLFNPPNALIQNEMLLDQEGFSGTDGGEVTGSWGESQIDLEAAGVVAGDTIQVRFAISRDGCGGVDGWYVDDVSMVTCEESASPTPTTTPTTTPTSTPTTTPTTSPTPTTTPTETPKAATTTKAKGPQNSPKYKKDFPVKVTVKADGLTPTGKVEISENGKVIAKGKLKNGKVTITIEKNLKVGKHTLLVKYLGSDEAKPSKVKLTVKVIKA